MRAAVAIGHKILIAAYRMLSTGADYKDLGRTHLDALKPRRTAANLVRRLGDLGYEVNLQPRAA
jgi:transposase